MANMAAGGAYLAMLRDKRGLTRRRVAEIIKSLAPVLPNENQIARIEKGEHDSRMTIVMAYLTAVLGSPTQYYKLINNERATQEDAEIEAIRWWQANGDIISSVAGSIPKEKIGNMIDILESNLRRLQH